MFSSASRAGRSRAGELVHAKMTERKWEAEERGSTKVVCRRQRLSTACHHMPVRNTPLAALLEGTNKVIAGKELRDVKGAVPAGAMVTTRHPWKGQVA